MTRLLLSSFALAIMVAVPARSDDVPFATPPLSNARQPATSVANLGDIMGKIQLRHIKIWYAIKFKNWQLLDYELEQVKDSFNNAVVLYHNIPVEYIIAVDEPLVALQKAAKLKDGSKLSQGFADLTAACNSCHKAGEVGFISIITPTSSPFTDQQLVPKEK